MLRMQSILDESAKKRIYESAIALLEKQGFLCNHCETLAYFREAGCKIGPERDRPKKARQVLFTEEIVGQALKRIPSEIILYPTAPGYGRLKLLSGETYFENSGGDYWRDMHSHELRPAEMQDLVATARLVDACENLDLNGVAIYWLYDLVATDDYDRYGLGGIYMALMCLHSGKHASTVYFTATDTEIPDVIRAWQICAGGEEAFRARPCGSQMLSAISPFFLSGKVEAEDPWGHADTLITSAKAGAVLHIEPCGLLGATAPVTVAGLVTQSIAEFMGMNVAVQEVNPGNPVVLNDYTGTFDMSTGGQKQEAWPDANLVHLGLTEMAHYVNAPIDCLVSSASLEADAQMGWENMGVFLSQSLASTDIICSPGATSVDKVFDPLALLMANEAISWVKHMTKGFKVDEQSIPLDLMMELGPAPLGGNFLGTDHTLELYKEMLWRPSKLTNSMTRDTWTGAGETTIVERASEMADEILASHEPDLPEDRQKALRELIAEILDREGVNGDEAKEIMEKTYWSDK
jgi:trimethylamine--corrinoid protein Co-methyltransferase